MKLPKNIRKALIEGRHAEATEGMDEPHHIQLVCTGTARRAHHESTVVHLWVDAATGRYVVDSDDDQDRLNRNWQNVDANHPMPYRRAESFTPSDDPRDAAYMQLIEMQQYHNSMPSEQADEIVCWRCKRTIQQKRERLSQLWVSLAGLKINRFDISHFDSL